MNARFLRLYLMPLWVSFGLLQSCRFLDIGLIDYPPTDHTQFKGPSDKTLETKTFRLVELITYPFYGSTLQVNQQFLLLGHNEAAGRLAQITASGVSELPKSDLSSLLVTPSGSNWGIKIQNEGFLIRHLTNGNWVDEGTIQGVNYYQTVPVICGYESTGSIMSIQRMESGFFPSLTYLKIRSIPVRFLPIHKGIWLSRPEINSFLLHRK